MMNLTPLTEEQIQNILNANSELEDVLEIASGAIECMDAKIIAAVIWNANESIVLATENKKEISFDLSATLGISLAKAGRAPVFATQNFIKQQNY